MATVQRRHRPADIKVPLPYSQWNGHRSTLEPPTPRSSGPQSAGLEGAMSRPSRAAGGFSDDDIEVARFLTGLRDSK